MKILFLFFILNYYIWKRNIKFLHKIIGIIFSFVYIIEYFIIFLGQLKKIYILYIYIYFFKEYNVYLKKKKIKYNFSYKKIKKINSYSIKKKNLINKIKSHYNYRRRYLGIGIVYIQMFKRWLKEKKNDIIYIYFYKWKKNYNILKKKIINNSLLFFFFNNYKLILYFDNLKKKLYYIVFYLSFIDLYKYNIWINYIFLLLKNLKIYYKNLIIFIKIKKW